MADIVPPRKKGGKAPPKLPLSLFSNSAATSSSSNEAGRYEGVIGPDPSTVHPKVVIDANVNGAGAGLSAEESGASVEGFVVSLRKEGESDECVANESLQQTLQSHPTTLTTIVPFPLTKGIPNSDIPSYLLSPQSTPVAVACAFQSTPLLSEGIKWALSNGNVVEIDVPWTSAQAAGEANWEGLEEIVGKGVPENLVAAAHDENIAGKGTDKVPAIVLSNLLPPPHSLTIPIVKLLSHPTYTGYQSHTAALSFIPNVYLKFLPPSWEDPTPPSPAPGSEKFGNEAAGAQGSEAKDEWKRRVKMFLGPAIDAFGYSRIIFGSSPSLSSTSKSTPRDWYALAREVVAELGVDQEGVDAIFAGNAKAVYSPQ